MRLKIAIAAAMVATITATAGTVWVDAQNVIIERPSAIGGTANPTDAQLAEQGIREVTAPDGIEQRFWTWGGTGFVSIPQAEIDAILGAEEAAAAAAQAEAEALAALPLTSATGFAFLDEEGHWVELLPTGDGLPVIGVQVSQSPLTTEQRAVMKTERKAAQEALKAAARDKNLNDKDKVALLMKAVFGVEK